MEKYCFWEYFDGTVNKNGQEARFMVPATRRFQQLARHGPSGTSPRIASVNPMLRAFCAASPKLQVVLTGDAYIDTEEQWKWLNFVLAQYLSDRGSIPSCRNGTTEMFRLGLFIPAPSKAHQLTVELLRTVGYRHASLRRGRARGRLQGGEILVDRCMETGDSLIV